jgi:hypothetical protein
MGSRPQILLGLRKIGALATKSSGITCWPAGADLLDNDNEIYMGHSFMAGSSNPDVFGSNDYMTLDLAVIWLRRKTSLPTILPFLPLKFSRQQMEP